MLVRVRIVSWAFLIAAAVGLTLAATASSNPSAAEATRKTIVFITPAVDREHYVYQRIGAKRAAKTLPSFTIELKAGLKGTPEELSAIIDAAVTKQASAIVINSGGAAAVKAALIRATAQGTKVVLFDVTMDGFPQQTAYLGPNNQSGGVLAGRWMRKNLPSGSTVGIIHCYPGIPVLDQRVTGFKTGIAGGGLRIVSTLDAKCDRALGRTVAEDMVSANPGLDGIFSISDNQTLGAYFALKAARVDPLMISFDCVGEVLGHIRAGRIVDACVAQFPAKMAYEAVRTAARAINGKPVAKVIDIPLKVVDKTNAKTFPNVR